jgi:hypothetical protein
MPIISSRSDQLIEYYNNFTSAESSRQPQPTFGVDLARDCKSVRMESRSSPRCGMRNSCMGTFSIPCKALYFPRINLNKLPHVASGTGRLHATAIIPDSLCISEIAGRLDPANSVVFKNYDPKRNFFQASKSHFYASKCGDRTSGIPSEKCVLA